jgi:hypothetical protein
MPRDASDEPPRLRPMDDYDPQNDYDDRPRHRRRTDPGPLVKALGITSLGAGVLALTLGFGCGGVGVVPGVIGLGLGLIGFLIAHQSRDRQSPVLPICGSAVNAVAIVVSVLFLVSLVQTVRQAEKDVQAAMAQAAREEAEREAERAKAAAEVEAVGAGGAVRVTAHEFYRAWANGGDRFDAVYKNKVIEITGEFHEVDFTGENGYAVQVKAGRDEATVDCVFTKTPEVRAQLARLRPRDAVKIRGKCLGGVPELEACVLFD